MIDLPIDDDGAVVRWARRHERIVRTWLALLVVTSVVGGVLAALLGNGAALVPAGLVLASAARSRGRWRRLMARAPHIRWTAGIDDAVPGRIRIDEQGVTVRHPALTQPLHLAWPTLRAFAVESPQPHRRRPQPSFPIERPRGSRPPIGSEPMHFLNGTTTTGVALSAELASIDLGSLPPNVAILLDEPQHLTIAAPLHASLRGWVPPDLLVPAAREPRQLQAPGMYLRVRDWERLRAALAVHGVREGFTSDDWRYATT